MFDEFENCCIVSGCSIVQKINPCFKNTGFKSAIRCSPCLRALFREAFEEKLTHLLTGYMDYYFITIMQLHAAIQSVAFLKGFGKTRSDKLSCGYEIPTGIRFVGLKYIVSSTMG